jgi:hypothetical protein
MTEMVFWGLDIGPWSEWAAAAASVGSVFIAARWAKKSTLAGVAVQVAAQRDADIRASDELKRRVAGALLGELEGLLARVDKMQMIKNFRDTAAAYRKPLIPSTIIHRGRQTYSAIYDSLADRLGCFEPDLSRAIAKLYVDVKGTIDSMENFYGMTREKADPAMIAMFADRIADGIESIVTDGRSICERLEVIADCP